MQVFQDHQEGRLFRGVLEEAGHRSEHAETGARAVLRGLGPARRRAVRRIREEGADVADRLIELRAMHAVARKELLEHLRSKARRAGLHPPPTRGPRRRASPCFAHDAKCSTRSVLPMPGGPVRSAIPPSPAPARAPSSRNLPSSASRPMSAGCRGPSAVADPRVRRGRAARGVKGRSPEGGCADSRAGISWKGPMNLKPLPGPSRGISAPSPSAAPSRARRASMIARRSAALVTEVPRQGPRMRSRSVTRRPSFRRRKKSSSRTCL